MWFWSWFWQFAAEISSSWVWCWCWSRTGWRGPEWAHRLPEQNPAFLANKLLLRACWLSSGCAQPGWPGWPWACCEDWGPEGCPVPVATGLRVLARALKNGVGPWKGSQPSTCSHHFGHQVNSCSTEHRQLSFSLCQEALETLYEDN